MSLRRILLSVSLTLGLLCLAEPARAGAPKTTDKDAPKAAEKPRVEVVFCLDTTGSMGGLIDAAKKKIWSISNQITTGKPTPQVKVGLVAFRDRGDEYITKVFDLTEDLDTVYTNLMGFRADGGAVEVSVQQDTAGVLETAEVSDVFGRALVKLTSADPEALDGKNAQSWRPRTPIRLAHGRGRTHHSGRPEGQARRPLLLSQGRHGRVYPGSPKLH